MPSLHFKSGVKHRVLNGHPWIFSSEIGEVKGSPQDGDVIEIYTERQKFLGMAFYNSRSQIVARRYTTQRIPLDESFLRGQLQQAFDYRRTLPPARAQRLFWSESDGLPGLIIDRYNDTLVLQSLTAAMARHEPIVAALALDLTGCTCLLTRNDAPVRQLEGLPLEKKVLHGDYHPPLRVECGGIEFNVDLMVGHKTGLYLDQMANYAAVAAHAAGKRVLDVFCHQGAFALFCARAGAKSVAALDQSSEALAQGRLTAERAGMKVDWIEANAFDWLRQAERERLVYDLVVLDPPSFTKSKQQLTAALRGYHELHVRALKLLPVGGLLASFSCSHSVSDLVWREMLQAAAQDVGCTLRVRSVLSQGPDHPVLLSVPETEYLRGFIVEKL